jgi:uncharacterized protein
LPEVLVNTSPLQYLHQIGRLELLPRLFDRVAIAGAVVRELESGLRLGVNVPSLAALAWVQVREPVTPAGVLLAWDLGAGEAATLSLALERPGTWVVLDDKLGRAAAAALGIPLLGTLGLLLRAKGGDHILAVRPLLDELASLGFRMSPSTRRAVLTLAGE